MFDGASMSPPAHQPCMHPVNPSPSSSKGTLTAPGVGEGGNMQAPASTETCSNTEEIYSHDSINQCQNRGSSLQHSSLDADFLLTPPLTAASADANSSLNDSKNPGHFESRLISSRGRQERYPLRPLRTETLIEGAGRTQVAGSVEDAAKSKHQVHHPHRDLISSNSVNGNNNRPHRPYAPTTPCPQRELDHYSGNLKKQNRKRTIDELLSDVDNYDLGFDTDKTTGSCKLDRDAAQSHETLSRPPVRRRLFAKTHDVKIPFAKHARFLKQEPKEPNQEQKEQEEQNHGQEQEEQKGQGMTPRPLFSNHPHFYIPDPARRSNEHIPQYNYTVDISAAELRRLFDTVLEQVDWSVAAAYVASNRSPGHYRKTVSVVFERVLRDVQRQEDEYGVLGV